MSSKRNRYNRHSRRKDSTRVINRVSTKRVQKTVTREPKTVIKKITNASVSSTSGIGSNCDFGANLNVSTVIPRSLFQQLIESEELYFSDWQAKKIVDIPVDDMLREGWEYTGLDESQQCEIETYLSELDIHRNLFDALRLERLHGGSAIFLGIADGLDDPSLPVDVTALQRNALKFMNVVERRRVSKIEVQTDPTKGDYGRPLHYWVNGQRIHKSRLLIFPGSPLLPNRLATTTSFFMTLNQNDGFGFPVLMTLLADLQRATLARQAAAFLIQRASNIIVTTDLQTLEEGSEGNIKLAKLNEMTQLLSNYNAAIIDGGPGQSKSTTIDTLAASFGSVPELIMSYLQVLSAASDIPATRFLGQAPGGLNATGDSDLENYYNRIGGDQKHRLKPILDQLLSIALPSALTTPFDMTLVDIEFNPLWNLSEVEMAQVRQTDIQNALAMSQGGLVTDEEALEEVISRGAWSNKEAVTDPLRETMGGMDEADPQKDLDRFLERSSDASNTPQ